MHIWKDEKKKKIYTLTKSFAHGSTWAGRMFSYAGQAGKIEMHGLF